MCATTWAYVQAQLPDAAAAEAGPAAEMWARRVRFELLPLIQSFEDTAWRTKAGRQAPWTHRRFYWSKALDFLASGRSPDADAAVKYAVLRLAAPTPEQQASKPAAGPVSQASTNPALAADVAWREANPRSVALLRAAAVAKLKAGQDEDHVPKPFQVEIEVASMVAAISSGRAELSTFVRVEPECPSSAASS